VLDGAERCRLARVALRLLVRRFAMNGRRAAMGLVFGLPATLAVAATAASGCDSSKTQLAGLAEGCSLNSDCTSPLVCVFSLCHNQCIETRDCPPGERCVSVGVDSNICELPGEASCTNGATCPSGLVCAADNQCRNGCSAAQACPVEGQSCVAGACYDPAQGDASFPETGNDGSPPADGTSPADGGSSEGAPDAPFMPNPDAGVLGFTPSNFDPAGVDAGDAGANWAGAQDADITTACTDCLPVTAVTIAMNGGVFADVYVLKSLIIEQTAALRLTGPNPIILAVLTTVQIQGQLLVNGSASTAGPGGFASGPNPGPGAGQPALGAADPNASAGGASFCGLGGTGGAPSGNVAMAGMTYGNATITPLVGGSAGGAGDSQSAGGGAIQIVAGQSITLTAYAAINAGGGGGVNIDDYAGGGSGGAILLEAPTVTIGGNLGANGGGGMSGFASGADATANATAAAGGSPYGGAGSAGTTINGANGTASTGANAVGGGGGGAGRIRINTANGSATITGIVSPALSTACATQGTLN
jgi:hypothetical protein